MGPHLQVFTTVEKKEDGRRIAEEAVARNLAACVQIVGPIASIYRWAGKVEEAEEWLLIMKSRTDLYDKLEELIKALHTYEVPEIVALPIACGNRSYLEWMDDALRGS